MAKKRHFSDIASYEWHQITIYLKQFGETSTLVLWMVMGIDEKVPKGFITKSDELKRIIETRAWLEQKLLELGVPFKRYNNRQSMNNELSKLHKEIIIKRTPDDFKKSRKATWSYVPMEQRESDFDIDIPYMPFINLSKTDGSFSIKLKKLDFGDLDCHIVPVFDSYDDPDYVRMPLSYFDTRDKNKTPIEITEPVYRQPMKDTEGDRSLWFDSVGAISTIYPKFKPEIYSQIKNRTIEYQRDILNIVAKEYQNQIISLINESDTGNEKTKEILKMRIINGDYDFKLTGRGWYISVVESTIEMDELINKILYKIACLRIVSLFTPIPHINPKDNRAKCAWLSDK